jgi:tetratricopeptide (TPR) repeat protein
LDDGALLAGTLMNMGFTQIVSGDPEDGIGSTQEALELFEAEGDEQCAAYSYGNLADAYQRIDRPDLAIEHAEHSLSVLRRLGNRDGTAEVLVTLGRAHRAKGDSRAAAAAWDEAADMVGTDHWLSPTIAELRRSVSSPAP